MSALEDRVLRAIADLGGHAYAIPLLNKLNEGRWYTNRSLLNLMFGVNLGSLYVALYRLEKRGRLSSEWSAEVRPERGYRARLYYLAAPHEETR